MNKKTIAASAVALLALGYVGSSFWLGKTVEDRYNASLETATTALGAGKIVSRSYERGVFGSKAQVVLVVDVPADLVTTPADAPANGADKKAAGSATVPLTVTLENDIHHGPFTFTNGARPAAAVVETRVVKVDGIEPSKRALLAKAAAPQATTLFGLDGSSTSQVVWPAGEIGDPSGLLQWQTLEYDLAISADGKERKENMRWPAVSLAAHGDAATPGFVVKLGGFNADSVINTPTSGQWLMGSGHGSGTIADLSIERTGAPGTAPTPVFAMSGMKLGSKMTGDAALLNVSQTATGRGKVGATPIDSIEFDMAFKNLDRKALASLQAQAVNASEAEIANNPQALAAIQQTALSMLGAKPEYHTRVRATFDGQTGEFGIGLALHEATGGAPTRAVAGAPAAAVLGLLSQYVDGEVSVRLPKSWLPTIARNAERPDVTPESIAEMAKGLQMQGFLKEEPEAWVASANLAAGQLLVNGKPLGAAPVRR